MRTTHEFLITALNSNWLCHEFVNYYLNRGKIPTSASALIILTLKPPILWVYMQWELNIPGSGGLRVKVSQFVFWAFQNYFKRCDAICDFYVNIILDRHAFIGLGFADRGDSFDLLVAIQDHFK